MSNCTWLCNTSKVTLIRVFCWWMRWYIAWDVTVWAFFFPVTLRFCHFLHTESVNGSFPTLMSSWGSYRMYFLIVVCVRQSVFLTLFPGFCLQYNSSVWSLMVCEPPKTGARRCKMPGNVSNQNYKQSKTGDVEGPGVYTIKVEVYRSPGTRLRFQLL